MGFWVILRNILEIWRRFAGFLRNFGGFGLGFLVALEGFGVTPCPCPGLHTVDVTYGGSPVPLSPFRVPVTEGCDPARVRVHGPGIQSGTTNQPNKFTVETR